MTSSLAVTGIPRSLTRKASLKALDAVVPDRPVMLYDWSGHSQWMNSKALRHWALPRHARPGAGSLLLYRDEDGNPTGWAKEFAVRQQMQALGLGGQFNADKLLGFLTYLRSMGVTTLYDAGNSGMGGASMRPWPS